MPKTAAIRDLCTEYLVCADAFISHREAGHEPVPEAKGTGRIAHRTTKNGVVLLFKGEEVHVDFTNL